MRFMSKVFWCVVKNSQDGFVNVLSFEEITVFHTAYRIGGNSRLRIWEGKGGERGKEFLRKEGKGEGKYMGYNKERDWKKEKKKYGE